MSNFRQRSRLAAAVAGLTLGTGWSIDVDGDGTADPSGPVDGRRKNYREKAGGNGHEQA